MFAGIVTVSCGHCHPKVVAAIEKQAETLQHATTIYLHPNFPLLAKKLASKMPKGARRHVFREQRQRGERSRRHDGAALHRATPTSSRCATAITADRPSAMGLTSHNTWKYPLPSASRRPSRDHPRSVSQPVHRHARGDRDQERRGHPRHHSLLDAGQDRGVHRRADPGRRRRDARRAQLSERGVRDRARARRPLHRRRSADRLRPHRRPLLGLRELRRRSRLRHDGQGHRQRRAARARSRRGWTSRRRSRSASTSTPSAAIRSDGGRSRRARRHRRGRTPGELRASSARSSRTASRQLANAATSSSATFAAWG